MRQRIIKILIAHDDPGVLRYLEAEVPRKFKALDIHAHVTTAQTFKETKLIIETEEIDVSFIYFGFEDGQGEKLMRLIKQQSPDQFVVAVVKKENPHYCLEIMNKYFPALCLTKEALSVGLDDYLKHIERGLRVNPYRINIHTQSIVSVVDLAEIAYIHGHLGRTEIFLYDFQAKKYKIKAIPMVMSQFLAEYDTLNLMIRCHRQYAVNRLMVEDVRRSRAYNDILLKYETERGYPVEVPMSESCKKFVIKELEKGVTPKCQKV